jgi:hypothetical protein
MYKQTKKKYSVNFVIIQFLFYPQSHISFTETNQVMQWVDNDPIKTYWD